MSCPDCIGSCKGHRIPKNKDIRDEFAMAALAGLNLLELRVLGKSTGEMADLAYQFADAMLAAREQKK